MLTPPLTIRAAMPGDIPDVLRHMRSLAEFEHYISDFTVDEKSLLTRAFGPHPECHIFVAECREGIIGYAVGLVIPFTYDLKKTLVLKEFFVDSGHRGKGAGSALFRHVAAWAIAEGGGRLKWDVMAGNQPAEAFYKKHGGCPDSKWRPYVMGEDALKAAANGMVSE
ncbi:GNAT family N-acetyltransferase [Chimaeribacter arupi]|uniref:GNAT family N-acetyltransferase n=1 Tax=Chimaeribacter arupi TaxID=2060066 RepID=A0A2N5EML4_9GAMM|nr:GNAT family N-acetyltransferase [Chimaeribacter arupi]MDV5139756.1 GNAT family N-acetyltransferase [Chimaeribacter arupi]PLR49297.1 GNAT family N-acetyltransferase [Chimaeribacter arupi]